MVTNADIADALAQISLILDLKGKEENPFRRRAYDRAEQMIRSSSRDMRDIYKEDGLKGLEKLPGIGKEIALKMEELITTGTLSYLEKIKKDVPAGLFDLLAIEGMGPKKTTFVWKEYGVRSIPDLVKLIDSGKLAEQKGWGEKSVANIKKYIELSKTARGRVPLKEGEEMAKKIVATLEKSGLCKKVAIAGSIRRKKETIGDIDILVTSDKPKEVMELFTSQPYVERIHGQGPTKSSVFLTIGIDADVRVVDDDVFGAALQYFTGNKDHNVKLRKLALKRGFTLSEYGLFKGTAKNKGDLVAARTEEDVYETIGIPWILPEKRTDQGEIEDALKKAQ